MLYRYCKTGAFPVGVTLILNDFSSMSVPSLTRTVPVVLSTCDAVGLSNTFPVAVPAPGLVVVTVMYAGPEPFEKVSGSPFGSVAWSVWFAVCPALTLIAAGWL